MRGGAEVDNRAMLPEVDETGVAVRGNQEMSVMFGIARVGRASPERVCCELPEKTVETPATSTEGSRGGALLVEFGPSICEFRIVKYAE